MIDQLKRSWQQLIRKDARPALNYNQAPSEQSARKRHEFVVIGLGRFGSSVAETLVNHGYDVLAIDSNAERVQHLSHEIPDIVQMDATNAEALRQVGVEQFETGLVCISSDFESNVLATTLLLRFGLKRVICKARSRTQKVILETLGAHQVILPEHEAGVHLARRLAASHFIDYLEMMEGVGIVEMLSPPSLWNHTLVEASLRQRFGLTVIAVRRGNEIIVNPTADFKIERDDILVVVGQLEEAEKLRA